MIKENDIILIYDGDEPYGFARLGMIVKALKPDEYHTDIFMFKQAIRRIPCFIKGDQFSVNARDMNFEPINIKTFSAHQSGQKKMVERNSLLSIYCNEYLFFFARVEKIKKAKKFGYYSLKLLVLQNPSFEINWTLKSKNINGDKFLLSGVEMRLEPVELDINGTEIEKFKKLKFNKNNYDAHRLSTGLKRKQKSHIVLIYIENQAIEYAQIIKVLEDEKPGWFKISFSILRNPEPDVTWILQDGYINGEEFRLGGIKMRIIPFAPPISAEELAKSYKKTFINSK